VTDDRDLAARAYALAWETSMAAVARQLGVSVPTLRKAFDRFQLGPAPNRIGTAPSRFAADRAAALEAFRLAERVGINQAARELGTAAATLNRAWAKHDLGRPTPPTERPPVPKPVRDRAVPAAQRAFLRLNPSFARPVGLPAAQQLVRARDREQVEAFGVRPVQAARAENSGHAGRRMWAVVVRARAAHGRSGRSGGRPDGRPGGRPSGMPGGQSRERSGERPDDRDRPGDRAGGRSNGRTGERPAGRVGDRALRRPTGPAMTGRTTGRRGPDHDRE